MAPEPSPHTEKTLLPGFGLRLNHVPKNADPDFIDELLPTALSASDMEGGDVA